MEKIVFIIGKNPTVSDDEIGIPLTDPRNEIDDSHSKITFDGINYILEDLNSKNGTYVNNSQIVAKMIVTAENSISLGANYQFSLLHPLIQSWVNKKFFENSQELNPIQSTQKSNKSFKLKITKKESATAATWLLLSIVLDIYSLFINTRRPKGEIKETLISFVSFALFLIGFSYLSKFFRSFERKGYNGLIYTLIAMGFLLNFMDVIGTFVTLKGSKTDPAIVGVVFISFLIILVVNMIIDIILNVMIISFDEDETKLLRPYAITSIIAGIVILIISLVDLPLPDRDADLFMTIVDVIPTLLLIAFFYKIIRVYKMDKE